MGTPDAVQNLVAQDLRVDADAPHTEGPCHRQLVRVNGIRASRLQREFLQPADVRHLRHRTQQQPELVGIQNGGRAPADINRAQVQSQPTDQVKGSPQVAAQPQKVVRNERQQALGCVGHKGAVGAPRRAEGDGYVDRAVALAGCSDEARLVDRHLGSKACLFGNDKVVPRQFLFDARLAHAALEQFACHLGRADAGQHPPRGTIPAQCLTDIGHGVPDCNLLHALPRVPLTIRVTALRLRLLPPEAQLCPDGHALPRLAALLCPDGVPLQGDPQCGRFRTRLLLVRKLRAGEKDHAQRLYIILVHGSFNVKSHTGILFPSQLF